MIESRQTQDAFRRNSIGFSDGLDGLDLGGGVTEGSIKACILCNWTDSEAIPSDKENWKRTNT